MTILGIDPGLATTGYGIIKKSGSKITAVCFGCIKTPAKMESSERLNLINKDLQKIIKKYKPDCAAVEQLFFCKNVKTAIAVGQARGVILLTLAQNKLPIYEFTPLQVKQNTTSYGKADKKQVQKMLKVLLNLKEAPKQDDAADALAVAYNCAVTLRNNQV